MAYSRVLQGCLLLLSVGLLATSCGGGGGTSGPPPCAADTRTCFVRTSGSDGNTGADPAHALQTISRAALLVWDGYTIVVGPGTYQEGVTTNRQGKVPQGVQFIADALGARTGDAPGSVIVDATGFSAAFNLTHSAGSLIDGFTITQATGNNSAGIVIKSGSDDFTIQNCIVHDNGNVGIEVQDSGSVLVFNNLVYRNGGDGITIVGQGSGSPNARLYNNTIFSNGGHGITIGTTVAPSPKASVVNNIVQDNDSPPSAINVKVVSGYPSPANDSVVGYSAGCNIVHPATYDPSNGIRGTHDFAGDALFVNAPTDFHLTPGSPAIDASDPNSCALSLSNLQAPILRNRTTTGTNSSPGPPDGGPLDLGFHFLRQRLS